MENQLITKFLDSIYSNKKRILCVGDAIIDEYYEVQVNRISPEHPVPIMLCQNNLIRKPGGSANVAYQLKNLNVDSFLCCLNDEFAENVFGKHGIKVINERLPSAPCKIPVKRRYVQNGVQVSPRLDIEKVNCGLTKDLIDFYTDNISKELKNINPDIVILSDYDKGFFNGNNNVLNLFEGFKTIVDPKKGPLEKWKGCTVFKPNAKEAYELCDQKYQNWKDQCDHILKNTECKYVIITRGKKGVVGYGENDYFEYAPEVNIEVKSVCGAGDAFASFFATSLAHGFSIEESSKIAHLAGLEYVQKRENTPVFPLNLLKDKLINPRNLAHRNFKLSFTNGCFDILHKGHIETLKFAKSKGDKLVVAINSDESIKRLKGPSRPIVPLEHRIEVMRSIEHVDYVVVIEEDNPKSLLEIIKPDVLVKGGDYQKHEIIGHDIVKEVFTCPIVPFSSTTNIISDFCNRN